MSTGGSVTELSVCLSVCLSISAIRRGVNVSVCQVYQHVMSTGGSVTDLRAAVAMRSNGQVLAVRLLDREMWHCQQTTQVVVVGSTQVSNGEPDVDS